MFVFFLSQASNLYSLQYFFASSEKFLQKFSILFLVEWSMLLFMIMHLLK